MSVTIDGVEYQEDQLNDQAKLIIDRLAYASAERRRATAQLDILTAAEAALNDLLKVEITNAKEESEDDTAGTEG
jgi:hypothetical protein